MPDTTENAVRTALDTLEGFFPNAEQRVTQYRADYGRGASIAKLSTELQSQLGTLVGNVDTAFANAIAERERALGEVRTKAASSPDGMRFLASLAGFGALAPKMRPEDFAARIESALNSGDAPSARAWSELAKQYANSPALSILHYRVAAEVVPEDESKAQADLGRVRAVRERYGLFRHLAQRRLADALAGTPNRVSVGSFGAAFIFAEQRRMNTDTWL